MVTVASRINIIEQLAVTVVHKGGKPVATLKLPSIHLYYLDILMLIFLPMGNTRWSGSVLDHVSVFKPPIISGPSWRKLSFKNWEKIKKNI